MPTFKQLVAMLLATLLAAQPSFASGVVADDAVGGGPRPNGQLLISNSATGGHTIVSAPVDGPFGRTFTFADPDGYQITLHEKA